MTDHPPFVWCPDCRSARKPGDVIYGADGHARYTLPGVATSPTPECQFTQRPPAPTQPRPSQPFTRALNRSLGIGLIVGFFLFATVAFAFDTPVTTDDIDDILIDHETRIAALEEGAGTTTTTTSPPDTTTTTTTTTTLPPASLPATIPYPTTGLDPGGGFQFLLACADPDTCPTGADGSNAVATLEYWGHGMPYLYPEAVEGNHDHAWWVNGDRQGYACAYGFLYDKIPEVPNTDITHEGAHLIARATAVRPLEAGYGAVSDKFMEEAERYYNGKVYTGGGNEIVDEDCQIVALDPDFDYAGYVPHGPDDIRVGILRADGAVADIRDFTREIPDVPGHWELAKYTADRVAVVFVVDGVGISHVVYYDALSDGQLMVEVNGQIEEPTA